MLCFVAIATFKLTPEASWMLPFLYKNFREVGVRPGEFLVFLGGLQQIYLIFKS